MADIIRFRDLYLNQEALSLKDMYPVEYMPGEDEAVNYRAYRRKRTIGVGEGGPIGESTDIKEAEKSLCGRCGKVHEKGKCSLSDDVDEALNLQQRMKRSRAMKRMKSRIKIGRERAKRKMADAKKLQKRAMRHARAEIVKKITKDIPKNELSFARRQEIEKRLDKPAFKARIKRMARKMYPSIRKAEVERKKG